jgi:hypothetical protein
MAGLAKSLLTLAVVILLAGCASDPGSLFSRQTETGRLLMDGPPALMTASAFEAQQANEVPLLYNFGLEANQIKLAKDGEPVVLATTVGTQQAALQTVQDWGAVTLVGEGYIDRQCQRFLSAIDLLEKKKKATLSDINAVQSATVGIMGLALAAQKAIGITAIAFGLGASLFDTTSSVVLYQLPAAGISSIVEAQRQMLRANEADILPGIKNQGLAAARLGNYVQYCVPLTIEDNINKVLSNSKADLGQQTITSSTPPTLTSPPIITHDVSYLATTPARDKLWQAIGKLTDKQVVALAVSLRPLMLASSAATQATFNAFDPAQRRFTDATMARRILGIWINTTNDLTDAGLGKIDDAIKVVSSS